MRRAAEKTVAGRVESAHVPAHIRVLVAFALGAVAFVVAIILTPWQAAILIGWSVTAATFVGWVWWSVGRLDSEATAKLAIIEEPSRQLADLMLTVASLASLLGVGAVLFKASGEKGTVKALLIIVATLSLLLSWTCIHTLFTLRYARLYYVGGGGISFNEKQQAPDYGDFAYVAFTVGMTYQVSDTALTSRTIRMTALRHAFLSFVFGTGIIATVINIVAGFFK